MSRGGEPERQEGGAKGRAQGSGSTGGSGGNAGAPRRRSPWRALRRLLLAGLVIALILGLLVVRSLRPVSERPDPVEFEVMPGWGASQVARELQSADLVRSAPVFSAYLRVRGVDRSIGEGLYDLDRSLSADQIARRLVEGGRPRVHRIVITEGSRASTIAQRLEEADLGSAQEYLGMISEPGELRPDYLPEGAGLEGYLFPASYEIPYQEEPREVLGRMLERFEEELDDGVRGRLEDLGLSVHEWVILGSLVQSEAGNHEEMPLIAGVFLNRLDLGMPLQSDPTVAYGLGKRLPELDAVAGDLQVDHPWNTYTRGGLPAGPIGSPGSDALRSVLSPVRSDEEGRQYLYFLHGFDGGEPVFRPNTALEGHNADVQRYLRGQ